MWAVKGVWKSMFTKPVVFKPGSVVLITGASSGVGRGIALKYAERGCKVVINARGQQALDEVVNACHERFGNSQVKAFAADMSDEA
jgi:NAD(P)-dependent dehydrogenase (short-subunit alcohol dehydrogenase family)